MIPLHFWRQLPPATRARLRVVGGIVAVPLLMCAVLGLVKILSQWLAATDVTNPAARAEEIRQARTLVLATLAGALGAIGAYYTHRNFALNVQGQITERFTRAVDQLGNEDSIGVRLGGIYALERLARESRDDHGPIIEILTAFVRAQVARSSDLAEPGLPCDPERLSVDVQAALTVLSRRTIAHDPHPQRPLDLPAGLLPVAEPRDAARNAL
jgi:hypothetical protein